MLPSCLLFRQKKKKQQQITNTNTSHLSDRLEVARLEPSPSSPFILRGVPTHSIYIYIYISFYIVVRLSAIHLSNSPNGMIFIIYSAEECDPIAETRRRMQEISLFSSCCVIFLCVFLVLIKQLYMAYLGRCIYGVYADTYQAPLLPPPPSSSPSPSQVLLLFGLQHGITNNLLHRFSLVRCSVATCFPLSSLLLFVSCDHPSLRWALTALTRL
eukprot:gene986-581_t